jgi:hypothetical protein
MADQETPAAPPEPILNAPVSVQPVPANQSVETPTKAPEQPAISPVKRKGGPGIPKGTKLPPSKLLITTDGKALIPDVVSAALGARTFAQASKPLSDDQKDLLGRALRMDVDEFRAQFASQLRSTAAGLLDQLQARMNELKPGEIPFALSVMVDKANAMDGRSALNNASINVVVNNFGPQKKDSLLSELDGLGSTKNVTHSAA